MSPSRSRPAFEPTADETGSAVNQARAYPHAWRPTGQYPYTHFKFALERHRAYPHAWRHRVASLSRPTLTCYSSVMGFGTILLLAAGLAMDATAVSAARGLAAKRIQIRHVFIVATAFGGFQALMPAIGWALGAQLGPTVAAWDHWIAFVLLAAIGGKMLWESAGELDGAANAGENVFGFKVMLLLALATSIDALAAGISLPMLHAPFATSIAMIGFITALFSAAGLFAGRRFGALLGKRLDAVGGLVLIGIGGKILVQHLSA